MGLLGNVAEVGYLRIHLMQERYVAVFANLLRSNSDGIEVNQSRTFFFFSIQIINLNFALLYLQDTGEINDIFLLHRFHIMQPVYWHIWHLMESMLGQ